MKFQSIIQKEGISGNFLIFFIFKYISVLAEMIYLERRHFRLNRVLLLMIGLWPYQKSKFTQIQFFVLFSILITFSAFQVRIHKSIFFIK